MSEQLEDEVLIGHEEARADTPRTDSPSTTAGDATNEDAQRKPKSPELIAALAAADAAASVTDTPAAGDSSSGSDTKNTLMDEQSVRLPHLPSPFDEAYPQSRGGDRWTKISPDAHCMSCELEKGEGPNAPVLNRVYGQQSAHIRDRISAERMDPMLLRSCQRIMLEFLLFLRHLSPSARLQFRVFHVCSFCLSECGWQVAGRHGVPRLPGGGAGLHTRTRCVCRRARAGQGSVWGAPRLATAVAMQVDAATWLAHLWHLLLTPPRPLPRPCVRSHSVSSPPPPAAAAAQVPKGLEMAVCQMNAGQQSLIRCCSDYGFSSTRRPAIVPVDAPLFFLVRVLRWEKEKNLHEMSLAEKFDYCDRRRQCGKDLFAGGKPLSAARQYDKAITALESIRNHEVEMKTVQQKNELITLFLVNQAQSEQQSWQQWQRRRRGHWQSYCT